MSWIETRAYSTSDVGFILLFFVSFASKRGYKRAHRTSDLLIEFRFLVFLLFDFLNCVLKGGHERAAADIRLQIFTLPPNLSARTWKNFRRSTAPRQSITLRRNPGSTLRALPGKCARSCRNWLRSLLSRFELGKWAPKSKHGFHWAPARLCTCGTTHSPWWVRCVSWEENLNF